jgi:hypothetical protein
MGRDQGVEKFWLCVMMYSLACSNERSTEIMCNTIIPYLAMETLAFMHMHSAD